MFQLTRSATMHALILLFMLQACNDCGKNEFLELTEETNNWVPYSQGQPLLFERMNEQTIITVFEFQETTSSYFRGDECGDGKQEVKTIKLISTLFSDTLKIRLERASRVILENVNFELTFDEAAKVIQPANNTNKKYETSVVINGATYTEVLISTCQACGPVSELIFSKNNGLVAFKLNDEYWQKKQ